MMSRLLSLIFLSCTINFAFAQSEQAHTFIDPTGAYKMVNKTKTRNGDTYGYFGDIKIKLVTPTTILINFYVCKGAPSYNSGSFADTLHFENNTATFLTAKDASCSIVFNFTAEGVTVVEKTEDYNSGCGFGDAVIADGFYKKTTSKILELKTALP